MQPRGDRARCETLVVESEEVSNGVILDFDAEGRIVAIELLDASKHRRMG
jgi:uncharacterized protein YuzE